MDMDVDIQIHTVYREKMKFAFFPLSFILLKVLGYVGAYVSVDLVEIGYGYGVNMTINDGNYTNLIDTGSDSLVVFNKEYDGLRNESVSCFTLYVDDSLIYYKSRNSSYCIYETQTATLDNSVSANNIEVLRTDFREIENPNLHRLNGSDGDLGLAYNLSCSDEKTCRSTAFQSFILASTPSNSKSDDNFTFGLDFRYSKSEIESIASTPSSMQLGGVSPQYENKLVWYEQSEKYPTFHHLFISDLSFCGGPLLGNISTNWRVLVDTGASCITLPEELYEHFLEWFDNTTVISSNYSYKDLPALQFRVFDSDNYTRETMLYIPLETLLIEENDPRSNQIAPSIYDSLAGRRRKFCILNSGSYIKSSLQGELINPAPTITFGAMALRSLYFAGNYHQRKIGIGSTLTESEEKYYTIKTTDNTNGYGASNPFCQRRTLCQGDEVYKPASNTCRAPNCKKYFFEYLDEDAGECRYKYGSYLGGLIFLGIIVGLEVFSYFILQYSAYSLQELRYRQADAISEERELDVHSDPQQPPRLLPFKVDPFTVVVGRAFSFVTDRYILGHPANETTTRPTTSNRSQTIPTDQENLR